MRIIDKPRGSGKTTELIITSYEKKIPIICFNYENAGYIKQMAHNLGLEIPDPIPFDDVRYALRGYRSAGVLIDDVDRILSMKIGLGLPVVAVSITNEKEEEKSWIVSIKQRFKRFLIHLLRLMD